MANKQDEVKVLFAWASPFSMRVVFALQLKNIPYEIVNENPGKKSQNLLKCNPVYKKVPVLLHNGNPICESSIIVQYIDDAWKEVNPFFPQDPYGRSQVRFWGDLIENKFSDSIATTMISAKAVPQANKDFLESCLLLEEFLLTKVDGPFAGGKEMNYVDVMIAPFALYIPIMGEMFGLELPRDQCPGVFKLFDAIKQHPAAKVALPETDKIKAFVNDRYVNRWAN